MSNHLSTTALSTLLKAVALFILLSTTGGLKATAQKKADPIFIKVDQAASFPGGREKLYAYLAKNLRYPAAAREKNIQGKVFLSFVVEKNGAIDQIKIKQGIGGGIDEEATRVIAASPKWTPAKHAGKIVRSQYTLPVSFTLDNSAAAPAKPVDKKQVYTAVDESAQFPGGVDKFYAYLAKTLHYPAAAREKNVQGRVFLSFVVEEDGTLTSLEVKRGIGSGCDEEALRAMQNSPKWIPAKLNGETVREVYTVPINFSLVKS